MGHLTKWLFFNLLFGAIPYGLTVALNQLQSPDAALLHPSSEVLFIAVVATSSALGELWDGGDEHALTHARSPWRGRWQLFLFLGVLCSSLLYGAYVYHSLLSPGRAHGIDCAAIASSMDGARIGLADRALFARWTVACGGWGQVQGRFFAASLCVTGFLALMSTAAVYLYPSRRGGRVWNGMNGFS